MRILFLSALLSCAVGAVVLAARETPTTVPTTGPASRPAAPVNKFCAVEHDNEVDPKVTIVYEGKVIGFCCKDCIKDFQKDPKKYMADLK